MRRGCISLGDVQCDECHRIIPYPERYLIIDQAGDTILCLCVDCCLNKGFARKTEEKVHHVITCCPQKP